MNEFATDQAAIDMVTTKFPAMKAASETYLDIHAALMTHDVDRLTAVIKHYKRANNQMDTAITTLKKNLKGVIAAATSQYANGPIEGVNRKIKALKRSCYGFANQEHMFCPHLPNHRLE